MKRNQISAGANFRKNVKAANREELWGKLKEWLEPRGLNFDISEIVDNNRYKFKVMIFKGADYYTTIYVEKIADYDVFNFSMIGVNSWNFENRKNEFSSDERNRKTQLGNKSAWVLNVEFKGLRGQMLVSYNTIIAFKPINEYVVYIQANGRGYSHTTNRHISAFCENSRQILAD